MTKSKDTESNTSSEITVKTSCFKDIFQVPNIVYEVPFFQRGYVWGKKEWDSLCQDINKTVFKNEDNQDTIDDISIDSVRDNKLFFGTIVLKQKNLYGSYSQLIRRQIIDGQQRMMTVYILLICLYWKLFQIENDNQEEHTASRDFLQNVLSNTSDSENNYNELKILSTQGNTLSIYQLLRKNSKPNLPNSMLENRVGSVCPARPNI